jgi:tetraacyldisaccharide-1-P 4'-kinase
MARDWSSDVCSSDLAAVEPVVRRYSSVPIYYAQTKLEGIADVSSSEARTLSEADSLEWRSRKFFVFCGIGNPKAFFSDLDRWGLKVAGWMAFRDHHRYSQQEMNEIERRGRDSGADALLCTEKDVSNLGEARASELPIAYCVISLVPKDPEQFWQEVNSIANSRRERATR